MSTQIEAHENEGPADQHSAYAVEFPTGDKSPAGAARLSLKKFYDVQVNVCVELGRVEMPIGALLQLGAGAVIELDRNVSEAVDVIAQGVRIARGEVCVVEDHYAVRITEIESDTGMQQSIECT